MKVDKSITKRLLDANYTYDNIGRFEEQERAVEILQDAVSVIIAVLINNETIKPEQLSELFDQGHRLYFIKDDGLKKEKIDD
jgi:DhnA family fructose-bisphosphate aldolase class Ia